MISTFMLMAAFLVFGPKQQARLEFEVASVKRVPDTEISEMDLKKAPFPQGCHGTDSSTSKDPLSNMSVPEGRCVFRLIATRNLVMRVFEVDRFHLSGGDGWLDSEFYEIQAKTAGPATIAQMRQMMQTLFLDRYRLNSRTESRELAGYSLVVAKGGAKLHASPSPRETRITVGRDKSDPATTLMIGQNVTIRDLVVNFNNTRSVSNMVVDQTSLEGHYDVRLTWAPEGGPSIFTAIQEQLGLKLESQKIRTDVMIIGSIQRPSVN